MPGEIPHEILRAIDIHTGKIAWELPETGSAGSWGGTLGFASGITFVCNDGGIFSAVDTTTGKSLWQFQTNVEFRASPMTYMFEGKQYVAIAAGPKCWPSGWLNDANEDLSTLMEHAQCERQPFGCDLQWAA